MRILISSLIFIFSLNCFADEGAVTGLPVPRFVVLKANETNLRKGPHVNYPKVWTYKQRGYPLKVVAEFENWRKLQDIDGHEGWVHENLITGTRNVAVIKNNIKRQDFPYALPANEAIIFLHPDEHSYPMARAQLGLIGKVKKCNTHWCQIKFQGATGWMQKSNLWGVFDEETIN